ncbi:MAG: protein kinase domain-containing protein [Actinomycetota bacterium]
MASDARIGTEIAGYRVESLIGRGGMSVVYLAEHARLHRKAALKLLAPELSENESFRTRFIRESELAAGLDHPNVIPVYDAGDADGLLYIAMRYVRGSDLKHLLQEFGPLDRAQASRVVDQVASALDAAHAEGLVHRDVKPANVLIATADREGSFGHLYLSDFGLTKKMLSATGVTRTGQFVGTLDYVAPEQIRSEAVDGRADVYSLGGMLFECLTGEPPYVRETEVAVMFAHLNDPPPSAAAIRPELPAAVDEVIARAMAKDPAERYPSAGAVASAARAGLGTGTAERETPPGGQPEAGATAERRRHRRGLVAAGAIVAVAVAILAVVLLTRGGGHDGARTTTGPSASTGPTTPGAGALVSIDNGVAGLNPATGALGKSFPLSLPVVTGGLAGRRPILAAEGALWIYAGGSSNALAKVSPSDGKVLDTVQLSPLTVFADLLAEGESSTWAFEVAPTAHPRVYRIDPATDRVLAAIPVGHGDIQAGAVASFASGIAVRAGTVWVTQANGTLSRIDVGLKKVTARYSAGPAASGLVVTRDAVWVADNLNGVVYRFDPVKKKVVKTVPLPGSADAITGDDSAVWVLDRPAGTVVRIDPQTNEVSDQIRVGVRPLDLTVGAGAVWVANAGDGTVTRINQFGRPSTTPVIAPPASPGDTQETGIAVGERGVWVTIGPGAD